MDTHDTEQSYKPGKSGLLMERIQRMKHKETNMATLREQVTSMRTREDEVVVLLDQMLARIGSEALGVMVVGTDGLVLSSRLHNTSSEEHIGAVAATIYGVTERVSLDLKQGHLVETIIEAETGFLLVRPINHEAVLAIDLSLQANLGMARLEARRMVPRLRQVLD